MEGCRGMRGRGKTICRPGTIVLEKLLIFLCHSSSIICSLALPVVLITAHTLAHTKHLHDHDVFSNIVWLYWLVTEIGLILMVVEWLLSFSC